jgi:hypothetical protein
LAVNPKFELEPLALGAFETILPKLEFKSYLLDWTVSEARQNVL